jgi:hypothetical protein
MTEAMSSNAAALSYTPRFWHDTGMHEVGFGRRRMAARFSRALEIFE